MNNERFLFLSNLILLQRYATELQQIEMDEMKTKFCLLLKEARLKKAGNVSTLTFEKYQSLLKDVKEIKVKGRKESRDYRLMKRFDVLEVQGVSKLISPLTEENNDIKYFVHDDELFDILMENHIAIGHKSRDCMMQKLKLKYVNITQSDVMLFIDLCKPCQNKKKMKKRGVVVKPMIFNEFNSRCQVDLIDYQTSADGEFKFVMVTQDHLTKFVTLKALKSKRAVEVAYHLLDIFTLFGAPCILQSDNGREFVNKIIDELKEMWPELIIVHGKPRHSQSQGSVERANQDVERMLTTWMQDNNTNHWAEGLRFVQLMKNQSFHSGIKRTPFNAIFGPSHMVSLASSTLPKEILATFVDEDDLRKAVDEINKKTEVNAEEGSEEIIDAGEESTIRTNDEINGNNDISSSVSEKHCVVCQNESSGAHMCQECNGYVHVICGVTTEDGEEGFGSNVMCVLCDKKKNITKEREGAYDGLINQSKKMKLMSDKLHPPAAVGSTVLIKVPDIDRSKSDPNNIMAVVMDVDENHLYRLGTSHGILSSLYTRSQFRTCTQKFIDVADVPQRETSLRSTASAQSLGSGQGFFKCACKTKCRSKRCICQKHKVKCNSKCHDSMPCVNK